MQLKVKDIRKSFADKEVLHGINFTVQSGKAMGFLGRNGAGKSTLFRCLMNVFRADSGQFLLDGKPFKPGDYRIGYLPEERGMYAKNKVLEQLVYFARLRGGSKEDATRSAKEWISFFELDDYANRPLEHLSKGNQQKIQIAQAFLNDPDILILDEPFSGLDPVNAGIFKGAIKEFVKKGALLIFSSHQMAYVEEVCDDISLIHEGDILLTGDLDAIKRQRGQHKLYMRVDDLPPAALIDLLKQAFPPVTCDILEESIIIDTGNQVAQTDIMAFLSKQPWTVARFGVYEPSLNDIFISLAGGEQA
ncbi:MAG: ATP-binding cassette domain-containing protein [Eubacteriales bacterium]|nr:ATP-binding cassette domain-containing protein [Eubacteriales bacterium]MDD4105376.1 ATP-binding cassette domain-containing protein [Eubacteriales bacterium]MDD4709867.1 ATP-binding cassette domain-containing protein [Eubacteriales bacterium]NLO15356.1 ATP-binding cassette domain-containing protein [Clostridiales bacterium]